MLQGLTFQQICALDYHRNMVVTSGPGAGKTRILSHRFCFILLTDDTVTLPQILTLTFTEKAAEEMKGRIYETLGRLHGQLQGDPRADGRLQEKIRVAKDQFHRNRISTIHAFCANLLREHPVESRMDPGFVIVQGARQRKMMEQAIETGISWVWENDREGLFPLLQVLGGRSQLLRALRHVIEHPLNFQRVIESSERLFATEAWQEQVFEAYCGLIKDEVLLPYVEALGEKSPHEDFSAQILDRLQRWRSQQAHTGGHSGVPDLFGQLRDLLRDRGPGRPRLLVKRGLKETSYTDLVEQFFPDLFHRSSPDGQFEEQLMAFLRTARVCMAHYQGEKQRINALDFADLEARCHGLLTDLFKKVEPYALDRIQRRFKYVMVDEFQDTNRVQWEIIKMLCSRKGEQKGMVLQPGKLFVVGDKRQAIYRFRGGDVTVFQRGTEEIEASNRERSEMFWENPQMVTRLLAWDQGMAPLLQGQRERFEVLPQEEREKIRAGRIYLPHNFRTDKRPIAFLNRAFEQIFSNKGARETRPYETTHMPIIPPEEKARGGDQQGSVTLYLMPGSSTRSEQIEREASLIVDIIEALLGRHGRDRFEYATYGDIREKIERNEPAIGILFFAFTHLKTFESILREAGLPFRVHRGKGFFQCQEVMEMIQLLNYLVDQRQHISLLATLRSPIFALSDAEIFDLFYGREPALEQLLSSESARVRRVGERIQTWRSLSERLTVAELIRRIITDQNLKAIHSVHPNGVQRLANMEKLMDVGRRFQAEGNGALPAFVTYCLEMAEEEEEEGEAQLVSEMQSPICLMTIHAAKGLEFPMVIIPDLNRRPPTKTPPGRPLRLFAAERGRPGDWNYVEGQLPVWPVEIPELEHRKAYGPLGYLLSRRNSLEEMAENRRVFYVGCSRTRNHLLLIGHMEKRWLKGEGRDALCSEDYRERATIMDLLNDIYQFGANLPPQASVPSQGEEAVPRILWREPVPKGFRGVPYGRERLTREHFGIYDHRVRSLDLTRPIEPFPYYQFSFRSIRIFRTCPAMFYYGVVLGLKGNGVEIPGPAQELPFAGEHYTSTEAHYVGNVIHRYLEHHAFGEPFLEGLFERVCSGLDSMDARGDSLDPGNLRTLREKARVQLQRTVRDAELLGVLAGKETYSEVPFLFSALQGCEFRGAIDRLFRDPRTGQWSILDWKSHTLGGRNPHQVVEAYDYDLQLACYRWAVESILREEVGDLYIYFTEAGKLVKSHWEGHPMDIIKEMIQVAKAYEREPQRHVLEVRAFKEELRACPYCEYRTRFCKGPERDLR